MMSVGNAKPSVQVSKQGSTKDTKCSFTSNQKIIQLTLINIDHIKTLL